MHDTRFTVPHPVNEPILGYLKGSRERSELKTELSRIESEVVDIPCVIGGREIRTGNVFEVRMPHDHRHIIARVHLAGEAELRMAVDAALAAKKEWEALPWFERAKIFLKAADLLAARGLGATLADMRFLKPLDLDLALRLAREHEVLLTVEEGSMGGFGAAILHGFAAAGAFDRGLKIRTLVLPDRLIDHDTQDRQYAEAGLDAAAIAKAAVEALGAGTSSAARA